MDKEKLKYDLAMQCALAKIIAYYQKEKYFDAPGKLAEEFFDAYAEYSDKKTYAGKTLDTRFKDLK